MKKTSSTYRNNNFGMLHLMAALFVIYGHEYSLLNQAAPVILGNQVHALGVKIIFLISGYLIAKSLFSMVGSRRKITLIYAIKRIGRLFPELFFCVIVVAFLIGPCFSNLTFKEYFQNINSIIFYVKGNLLLYPVFYLPGVFESNPYFGAVNGSLWTMPIEFAMYIFFLLIVLPFKNRRNRKIIYALFGTIVFVLWSVKSLCFSTGSAIFYGTDWSAALNLMVYFVIGGAVYLWDLQKLFNIQKAFFLVMILCGIHFNILFIEEIICMVAATFCVFSLGFAEKQSIAAKKLRPECAYGVYLWGFPVQQCIISLWEGAGKVYSPNLLYLISVVITYLMALASYKYVYTPL